MISDHHQPAAELPQANAVICPKQEGDTYPDKDLSGAGLAYKIAQALGLPTDAPSRVEAGAIHALNELADDGHVYAPASRLVTTAAELLSVDPALVPPALDRLEQAGLTLATSLGACCNAALLLWLLLRNGYYRPQPGWIAFLAKVCVAAAGLAYAMLA